MAFAPMPRESMRELNAKTVEENRVRQIEQIVRDIYSRAIQFAKGSTGTVFKYIIENPGNFYNTNMDNILASLQSLFPGCSVEHKVLTMARGIDGVMRDVSTMDPVALKFIAQTTMKQSIVIDWS